MKFGFFKKRPGWIAFWGLLFLLMGCCRITPSQPHAYRVITQIQITYQNGPLSAQRQFFQEEKIAIILDYLRYIDPYGTPSENPEEIPGSDFYITVIYSDGTKRLYRQRADRYLRVENGPWKRIDPRKSIDLSHLLGMTPSDPPSAEFSPVPPLAKPRI